MDEFQEEVISQLASMKASIAHIQEQRNEDRDELAEDRANSSNSRRDLHKKIDAALIEVVQMRGDLQITAQVSAMARDEVKALTATVNINQATIAPILATGKIVLWVAGLGAGALITASVTIGGLLRQIIAAWLGIK